MAQVDGTPSLNKRGLTVKSPAAKEPVKVRTLAPLVAGLTVMVAVTGVPPVFTALNEAIFPIPLAARPIDGVLFVQLNTVPATGPVKVTAVVGDPLHTTWLVTGLTVICGPTVVVNDPATAA